MDKRLKLGLIGLIGIFVIVGIGLLISNTLSDNPVPVIDNVLLSDQDLGSVLLTNIELTQDSGIWTIKGTVTAKEDTNINYIKIILKNSENEEILSLIGYVGSSLSQYDTRKIIASTEGDLSSISKIEYEVY